VDQKAHTVAFKDASGKTMTAQLQPRAEKDAAGLKAGDRVRLTCQDNAKGEHQVITAVQRVCRGRAVQTIAARARRVPCHGGHATGGRPRPVGTRARSFTALRQPSVLILIV
jgi:hypothetical protein